MAACDAWSEQEMIGLIESKAMTSGDAARNRCLFALQCATGGRISELLSVRRRDVVDSLGRLEMQVTFTDTKNGESRTVALVNPFPRPFLAAWLQRQEERGFCKGGQALFSTGSGRRLSRWQWYRLIKRACAELRLRGHYGTHSARKTWARDTYRHYHQRQMAGELVDPLVKLQEAGGWKTLEATRRYIAFMLGDTTEAQADLYPELQQRYGSNSAQNYQTLRFGEKRSRGGIV